MMLNSMGDTVIWDLIQVLQKLCLFYKKDLLIGVGQTAGPAEKL